MEEQNNNQYTNGQNTGGADNQNGVYYQPPADNSNPQQYYQPPADNGGMYPPPQPPKKKNKAGKIIGIILGIIVFIFVALFVIGLFVDDSEDDGFVTQTTTQADGQTGETESQTQSSGSGITQGVISDNTYSNAFAGFGIDLPDSNWAFVTGDQLYEMLAENSPQRDENGAIYIESEAETAYYDLMMMNSTTGTNIQVILSDTNAVAGVITSEDLYLSNATSSLADSTTVIGDTYDLTIAGENYKAVNVDYTSYGTTQTLAVRKVGSDFVCLIVTVYSGLDMNGTEHYTNLFYAV